MSTITSSPTYKVIVNDKMQKKYSYELSELPGKDMAHP